MYRNKLSFRLAFGVVNGVRDLPAAELNYHRSRGHLLSDLGRVSLQQGNFIIGQIVLVQIRDLCPCWLHQLHSGVRGGRSQDLHLRRAGDPAHCKGGA